MGTKKGGKAWSGATDRDDGKGGLEGGQPGRMGNSPLPPDFTPPPPPRRTPAPRGVSRPGPGEVSASQSPPSFLPPPPAPPTTSIHSAGSMPCPASNLVGRRWRDPPLPRTPTHERPPTHTHTPSPNTPGFSPAAGWNSLSPPRNLFQPRDPPPISYTVIWGSTGRRLSLVGAKPPRPQVC